MVVKEQKQQIPFLRSSIEKLIINYNLINVREITIDCFHHLDFMGMLPFALNLSSIGYYLFTIGEPLEY